MKKLIALLAVLGIFSLNLMALPIPSPVAQGQNKAQDQNNAEESAKIQQTTLALQIAITSLNSHLQTDSLNTNEIEIVNLLESEELWKEIEDIGEFTTNEMAQLENLKITSEEDAERISQELNNSLLGKLRGSNSLSNVTNLLLQNQQQYSLESLDSDFALFMTYAWIVQIALWGEED